MSHRKPTERLATHRVHNQPPPLVGASLFEDDAPLREALERGAGARWLEPIRQLGERLGSEEVQRWGAEANAYPPQLNNFNRFGQRIDEVDFHPAYHALMSLGIEHGITSIPWQAEAGGHSAHAALLYLLIQVEPGVCCPLSMSYAGAPVLKQVEPLTPFRERLIAGSYDPRSIPWEEKRGVTMGMAMTEKQGGSDVRANETRALRQSDGSARLIGHKWFCSAPMSDAFLTLARCEEGLSCFFVPRWQPDGTRNGIRLQRLKDKLGNRANASGEIEYEEAWALPVGAPGAGVRTIIEMVHHTRFDSALGNAGLMRQATRQALWHCTHREAFGARLIEQPLMRQVLADLALESEAATTLMMRIAEGFDAGDRRGDEAAQRAYQFTRLATAVAKYWVCKRAPAQIYEALECHGGAGYIEESIMPRLYREAPLSSIWEGSGNVICLDILRALGREPESGMIFLEELERARGGHRAYDRALDELKVLLGTQQGAKDAQRGARRLGSLMARTLQAALLLERAPSAVAEGFCAARLGDAAGSGQIYGDLPASVDCDAILARWAPQLLS